ncbi:Uncharacterised protein [Mycobacteroides abscessus subsp. massiliense]|nr:Uncharacterised protein [Mycobacteroides abscessus subsp. massiliense]
MAHWLRLAELADNPDAPALFDYRWNGDRWESASDYQFHCSDGGAVIAARSDFLIPNGDGSFSGERTFTVGAPGCPDDGPGTADLPPSIWSVRPGHLHLTGCLGCVSPMAGRYVLSDSMDRTIDARPLTEPGQIRKITSQ